MCEGLCRSEQQGIGNEATHFAQDHERQHLLTFFFSFSFKPLDKLEP